ncbi:TIGR00725 family protein [Arthrobacter subterraneus]|uniref:TIGR00725 family protein n=1 Tax=Arthrobacter subterraneus TaxID=335973 RepID=A0A1G8CMB1_9MICC|nr:DNA-binding protein [Arthrobacter sp. ZXY-2]SDH46691.1 TIGR00725 family protein [Arthrobacter subterraneus]
MKMTDTELLSVPAGPADDPARMARILTGFEEGFDALARIGKAVTVFGSSRTPREDPDYDLARRLGAELAGQGFTVITGGGPGIMAANRGAKEAGGTSVGLA